MNPFRTPCRWRICFLVVVAGTLLIPDGVFASEFSSPVNLSQTPNLSWLGRIVAVGDHVFVVWSESGPEGGEIVFSESSNRGQDFGPVRSLSNRIPSIQFNGPIGFGLWAQGTRLFVIWPIQQGDLHEIFLASYDSHDQTIRPPRRLLQVPDAVYQPLMALDGQHIYVAWLAATKGSQNRQAISLTRLSEGESNAQTSQELFVHEAPGFPSLLMTAKEGVLYLCWLVRTKDGEMVRVARSTDQGLNLAPPIDLATSSATVRLSTLVVSGAQVFVAWSESKLPAGVGRLFLATSADHGVNFSGPRQLSEKAFPGVSITGDGRTVSVAWIQEYDGRPSVAFARSNDFGKTFSAPMNISRSHGGLVRFAQLQGNREQLTVIWKEENREPLRKSDIFYSTSVDRGATFSLPKNLSQTVGNSTLPGLDGAGSYTYAIWADDTHGNFEIFFSRSSP